MEEKRKWARFHFVAIKENEVVLYMHDRLISKTCCRVVGEELRNGVYHILTLQKEKQRKGKCICFCTLRSIPEQQVILFASGKGN